MKIALIDGSLEQADSISGQMLEEMKPYLTGQEWEEFYFYKDSSEKKDETAGRFRGCGILLFAVPFDGEKLSSHMEGILAKLKLLLEERKSLPMVYAMAQCGAYDGNRNAGALDRLKTWCEEEGILWGQGLGMGAGGMLLSMQEIPIGQGPKKEMGKAFAELAEHMASGASGEDLFLSIDISRFSCQAAAGYGWRLHKKEKNQEEVEK